MVKCTQPTKPTCAFCGSDNITADAVAKWNVSRQCWELVGVLDDGTCEDCQESLRPRHIIDVNVPYSEFLQRPLLQLAEHGQILVACTSHLSEADVELFDLDDNIASRIYGYYVALLADDNPIAKHLWDQLSEGVKHLLRDARDQGFYFVMFDRDAEEIDGYTVHDW